MRRRRVISVLAALAVVLWVIPYFLPWTPLNCTREEIDITTGQMRSSRYLLFCKVTEKIKDTPISSTLAGKRVGGDEARWHLVNTFSPGHRNSPHYVLHAAFGQSRTLSLLWKSMQPPPDVKRRMAEHVLALWQHREADTPVDAYLRWFSDFEDDHGIDLGKSELVRQRLFERMLSIHVTTRMKQGGFTIHTARFPDGSILDEYRTFTDSSGRRLRDGVSTRWQFATEGEQAEFKNDAILVPWKPVTRPADQEWLVRNGPDVP